MKSMISIFAAFFIATGAVSAATVESVTANQQWPWSTDIKVKYKLSGVNAPVDLQVSAVNGDKPLAVPRKAIKKGDTYGIKAGDEGRVEGSLIIDPVAAFGTEPAVLADLKIKIEVSDSPANMEEALYRIYDLDTGTCTDVTRVDLLNGKWGAVETSYQAIDPNFKTDLEDVLIWTDVTNNPAYRTDKLVMRKVHAKDVVWQSGDPEDVLVGRLSKVGRCWVKLTYDYYISVFETTQAQYRKIMGSVPSNCVGEDDGCPVNMVFYHHIHGHPSSDKGVNSGELVCFPTNSYVRDVGKSTLSAKIGGTTGVEFTLPTLAEWEFACRGGNDGVLYTGEPQTIENVGKIAWTTTDSNNRPGVVGTKLANAYGLYDMLGNVMERVLGSGSLSQGGLSGGGGTESDPVVNPLGNPDTTKDTNPYSCGAGSFSYEEGGEGKKGRWEDCRHAARVGGWYEWWAARNFIGFRLVCPVTGTWGADWPKTILSE